ncbi:MAG: hypothetical protein QOD99_780 [Chthoniobacter sp.]|jgi:protein SCO1/2|nr:hypothetical protein [Chthoniobacter sp.]
MSPRLRIIVWTLLCVTTVFALSAIGVQVQKIRQPPLPKFKQLPEFQLTERTGKPVTLSDLKGKVWLADFIYTTCPGPCPMISSHLATLQKSALQQDTVRFVSISTDPSNDTPEVLRKYAEHLNASDKWLFLTGEKAVVYDLIEHGFFLAVAEQADEKNRVVHSTKIALVDKQGVIRKYFNGENAEQDAEILRDIAQLLRE